MLTSAAAGIVPPLGDCAMLLRRSSGNRTRGWSSESIISVEEPVLLPGNTNSATSTFSARPVRQPFNPPAEDVNQKDEGFVRFLKKHSSPTHNRVTAGGRIVPMEKRSSPPKFALSQENSYTASYTEGTAQQEFSLRTQLTCTTAEHAPAASGAHQHAYPQRFWSGQETNPVTTIADGPDTAGTDQHAGAGEKDNGLGGSYEPRDDTKAWPGMVPDVQCPGSTNPQFMGALPYYLPYMYQAYSPGFPYGPAASYSADIEPFTMTGQAGYGLDQGYLQLTTAQERFNQAEDAYNNFDLQLKELDRHRAMSHHDPNISNQRMAIVERRAGMKDLMQRARRQLDLEQSSKYHHSHSFLGTNAAIPPFVSQAFDDPKAAETTQSQPKVDHTVKTSLGKSQPAAKSRAIPILPPPDLNRIEEQAPQKVNMRSEIRQHGLWYNDQGEVVVGHPREVKEEQDLMLEAKLGASDASARYPGRDNDQYNSAYNNEEPSGRASGNVSNPQDIPAAEASETTKWLDTNVGHAPKEVEDYYDLHLDAMRLPTGVVTRCPMVGGGKINIPGSGLQRPQSSQTGDWEKQYWQQKPVFTRAMLANLKKKAEISQLELVGDEFFADLAALPHTDSDKENDVPSPGTQRRAKVEKYMQGKVANGFARESAPLGQLSLSGVNVQMGNNATGSKAATTYTTPPKGTLSATGADQSINAIVTDLADSEWAADQLSNKGYSSVSVQNVHATVRLPPALDGSADSVQRSAVSLLNAAGKNGSPRARVLHRSTPNGRAWYGPHYRPVERDGKSADSH